MEPHLTKPLIFFDFVYGLRVEPHRTALCPPLARGVFFVGGGCGGDFTPNPLGDWTRWNDSKEWVSRWEWDSAEENQGHEQRTVISRQRMTSFSSYTKPKNDVNLGVTSVSKPWKPKLNQPILVQFGFF